MVHASAVNLLMTLSMAVLGLASRSARPFTSPLVERGVRRYSLIRCGVAYDAIVINYARSTRRERRDQQAIASSPHSPDR